jgi:hypothetical protein
MLPLDDVGCGKYCFLFLVLDAIGLLQCVLAFVAAENENSRKALSSHSPLQHYSMLTLTTLEMAMTNTLATIQVEFWIATILIVTGSSLACIGKSSISMLNRSRSICGLLMSTSTLWRWQGCLT